MTGKTKRKLDPSVGWDKLQEYNKPPWLSLQNGFFNLGQESSPCHNYCISKMNFLSEWINDEKKKK